MKYPLNYTKNNGVTALGIAAFKGHLKILDMLYRAGADINIGTSPLYLAIKTDKIDAVKFLIERGALVHDPTSVNSDYSPLFQSINLGNLPALEVICDSGVDLDLCKDQNGYTPLAYAVILKQDAILNYLSLRVKNLDCEIP